MAKEAFNKRRSIFCGPLEKELGKGLVKCFGYLHINATAAEVGGPYLVRSMSCVRPGKCIAIFKMDIHLPGLT